MSAIYWAAVLLLMQALSCLMPVVYFWRMGWVATSDIHARATQDRSCDDACQRLVDERMLHLDGVM